VNKIDFRRSCVGRGLTSDCGDVEACSVFDEFSDDCTANIASRLFCCQPRAVIGGKEVQSLTPRMAIFLSSMIASRGILRVSLRFFAVRDT
jgi:hypothetical protein